MVVPEVIRMGIYVGGGDVYALQFAGRAWRRTHNQPWPGIALHLVLDIRDDEPTKATRSL